MVVKHSKQLAILKRHRAVADLFLQGWTQTAIAEELSVAQPTICDDLQRIRTQWRESAVRDFDEARQLELMKLDRIEREAWRRGSVRRSRRSRRWSPAKAAGSGPARA